MHSNGVCVLTPRQAYQLEFHDIVPNCREHRHLSRGAAEELIGQTVVVREDSGDFARQVEARWIGRGKKYLAFVRSREWKRMESAGTTVMQLVPAGGVW